MAPSYELPLRGAPTVFAEIPRGKKTSMWRVRSDRCSVHSDYISIVQLSLGYKARRGGEDPIFVPNQSWVCK